MRRRRLEGWECVYLKYDLCFVYGIAVDEIIIFFYGVLLRIFVFLKVLKSFVIEVNNN